MGQRETGVRVGVGMHVQDVICVHADVVELLEGGPVLVLGTLLLVLGTITYRGKATGGDAKGSGIVLRVADISTEIHVMDYLIIVRAAFDSVVVHGHVVGVLDGVLRCDAVIVELLNEMSVMSRKPSPAVSFPVHSRQSHTTMNIARTTGPSARWGCRLG